MGQIELYTYSDLARIFRVSVNTIRNWKWAGQFKVLGYRKLGMWAKEAVVSEEEVKKLIRKKYIRK